MLAARLGGAQTVLYAQTGSTPEADLFYGTVSGPWAVPVHDMAGLDEGTLLRRRGAALSWGTRYSDWGPARRSWTQCYHQPFATFRGVEFHQVLRRFGLPLEPFLVPAAAAAAGTFAHPSPDPASPLSRAEYGYQFDPAALEDAFREARNSCRTETICSAIDRVDTQNGRVTSVLMRNGDRIEADLYVDATGPDADIGSRLGSGRALGLRLTILESDDETQASLGAYREVVGTEAGWSAATPLRGRALRTAAYLTDEAPTGNEGARRRATAALGRAASPWTGNCVAIGQAAAVLDPLTCAPLLLLYRDLQRLVGLLPRGDEQGIERREYNRLFAGDAAHTDLFHAAFFAGPEHPRTSYHAQATADVEEKALRWKIAQYESRGLLVQYDLEPFNKEDWLILHDGLGRRAARYDRLADALPEEPVRRDLAARREAIATLASRMPPLDRYLARYLDYLDKNP